MSIPSPELTVYERANRAFERTLDDLNEQLLAVCEGADGWIECLVMSVGFFLLSTGQASIEHIESGFFTMKPNEHAVQVITRLIAVALTVRLLQRWAVTWLRYNTINASFGQIVTHFEIAKKNLIESHNRYQQDLLLEQDNLFDAVKLPVLEVLFDGANHNRDPYQDFGRDADAASVDAAALIDRRLAECDPALLAQWYPAELVEQARAAAMDVERIRCHILNEVEPVSTGSQGETQIPSSERDDRADAARSEWQRAIERLKAAQVALEQQRQSLLRGKQEEFASIRAPLPGQVLKVKLFRRLAKANMVASVSVTSLIAVLTFGSIWLPHAH